jgi:DNA-binding NtrC family response regulator
MNTVSNLLIVDDDENVLAGLEFLLSEEQYHVFKADDSQSAIKLLESNSVDLVLTDMNFRHDTTSGKEGFQLIELISNQFSGTPVIVMTGWATIDIAVKALKLGAKDFVQKPWNDQQLLKIIATQLHLSAVERKAESLTQHNRLLTSQNFPTDRSDIVAESKIMRELLSTLEELAQSDMNILLSGENGTGKSMLAQFIHDRSARHDNDFVSVNMGAISENLFESEMFGHVRGAFTDAKKDRIGRFEMAESGTLFLDELANIPISQQAKLLRVLEENRFEKVGSSRTQIANVRIISATNADLNQLINDNQFRQDLYYRLNTIEITIPSLADRVEDILPLANAFLTKHAQKYQRDCPKIGDEAKRSLKTYPWPGNVRELSHTMERALFICRDKVITPSHLNHSTAKQNSNDAFQDTGQLSLDEIEKSVIKSRLKLFDGNVTETAKSLGLSRSGYYRRVQKYGLEQ